jgi:hypothetical protein
MTLDSNNSTTYLSTLTGLTGFDRVHFFNGSTFSLAMLKAGGASTCKLTANRVTIDSGISDLTTLDARVLDGLPAAQQTWDPCISVNGTSGLISGGFTVITANFAEKDDAQSQNHWLVFTPSGGGGSPPP